MDNAPSYVLGIAFVRGIPTPVVDLGVLFEAQRTPSPSRFVSLRIGDRTVALAVSAVRSVQTLGVEVVHPLPPLMSGVGHDAVEALGRLDAELLVVLSASRIIPEEVLRTLVSSDTVTT